MPRTQIEQIRFDALVRIAQKNFDPALHQGEARAIAHSVAAGSLPVPGQAEPRLPVRPDFLRWLATDSEARPHIDAGGIKVWSAAVPGKVDLRGCTIPFDLHFLGCAFQGPLVLQTAEIRSLWMLGCSTEANIEADGLVSRGSVMMRNLESKGAVRLVNARISNSLDLKGADLRCNGTALALDGADVHGSVFLDDGFKCSGEVRMLNARIDGDFGCNGAQFTSTQAALSLDKVVIHGNASLTGGFVSSGLIRFSGAHIYGDVDFKGAVLTASVEALNLNTTAIDGHIYLREGFESAGLVSLQYSRIGNTVDCGGGKFSCPTTSLRLEAMSARHVYLSHGFSAAGLVELQSADINGDLNCDQCCMPALYCPFARIGGDLIWTSVQKPGQTKLCLNKTTVGTIKDDRQSWPSAGSLSLDGLSYGDLILHESITDEQRKRNSFGTERGFRVEDRIAWLNLQSPEALITPQPWIHLADFLKARGEAASAKRVVFELKRHQANAKNSMLRWGMIWLSWLEEQPLRIFWSVVLLTLMGSILFWHAEREGAMAPTNEAAFVSWARGTPYKFAYPRFNAAMYSLENTLPLVKLGQDAAWGPKAMQDSPGWLTSYGFLAAARWFLILAGWIQATALASAIGGRFKP